MPLITDQDQLRARRARPGREVLEVLRRQHRRFVDDEDGSAVPARQPGFEAFQLGGDRRGVGEAVALHVVNNGIGPGEAEDVVPGILIGVVDSRYGRRLTGAGGACHNGQALLVRRVQEGGTLFAVEMAMAVENMLPDRLGHAVSGIRGEARRIA